MIENRIQHFQRVLMRLLQPIARAMIAHGVTLNAAIEIQKRALYDAALAESRRSGKVTDSRISLRTGLHRKDVRRFREAGEIPPEPRMTNVCGLVVSLWTVAAPFLDKRGRPRTLDRLGTQARPGFDDLIREARVDLPAATVLEVLAEQGAVSFDRNAGIIRLEKDVFLANPDSTAMLEIFEKNLRAHLDAATQNLLAGEEDVRHFERALHVNRLSDESVLKLRLMAGKLGGELLRKLNRKAMSLQERDINAGSDNGRVSIGIYIFGRPSGSEEMGQEKE